MMMPSFPYRERLRNELVGAIGRYEEQRRRHRKWLATSIVGVLTVSLVASLAYFGLMGSHPTTVTSSTTQAPPRGAPLGALGPEHIGPSTSLSQAEQAMPFRVLVPNTSDANSQNLTGTYVDSGQAIEMDFPQPTVASADLLQPSISVWEAPWTEGDPLSALKTDVQTASQYGIVGLTMCQVKSLPAVCVEPRASVRGVEEENAAFVRFIVGNVEVHVYGGDSVQRLVDIAESLTN
jgi:hypothetical protein